MGQQTSERQLETMSRSDRRSFTTRDGLGVLGAVAFAWMLLFVTGYLQHGWHPGEIEQYAVSEGLENLVGPWQFVVVTLALLALVPLQWSAFLIAFVLLPAPFLAVIHWEGTEYRGSHNLFPFEVMGLYIETAPALGLAALVKVLRHGPPKPRRRRPTDAA